MGKADNIAKDLQPLAVPITSLQPYGNNSRRRTDANLAAIRASFDTFGQQRPILVYRFGRGEPPTVIAGNGGFLAAKGLGWSKIAASHFRGTAAEARAYAIADNRIAELSEWDAGVLGSEALALRGQAELDSMLDALHLEDILGVPEPDAALENEIPDPPKVPISRPGDLWALGVHRLLCGDSTSAGEVERLLSGTKAQLCFTDPPYGVDYQGGMNKKKRNRIAGDLAADLYGPCCRIAMDNTDECAVLYLWHAGSIPVAESAKAAGWEPRCQIIWNKTQAHYGALGSHYKPKHEPILYCAKRGAGSRWCGPTNEVSVWDYPQPSVNEFHPTQKPVALALRAIGNHDAAAVMDLFGGSGSTMLACEQLARQCFMVEIDPAFCDVIVERWQRFTGGKATRA